MKKILRFCRNWLVLILWTMVFVKGFCLLTTLVWNFNFLSERSWQIFADFWNQGGVLNTAPDVLLLFSLLLMPVFWFVGAWFCIKQNYAALSVRIIERIFSVFSHSEKYTPKHIALKNVKTTQQAVEEIKDELASLKPDKSEEAGSIRTHINKKLRNNESASEN
jgi:hypothetical protein